MDTTIKKTPDYLLDGSISLPETVISMKRAHHIMQKWQRKLDLHNWNIELVKTPTKLPNAAMEIVLTRPRKYATIRIAPETWHYRASRFEKYMIHELTHLVVDPMWEENDIQRKYSVPKECDEERKDRFALKMEQTVEHLTHCLYDLEYGNDTPS